MRDRLLPHRIFLGAWLTAALIILWFLAAPTVVQPVGSTRIRIWAAEGNAYVFSLLPRVNWFTRCDPDTLDAPQASTLVLLEDGRALGPAHTLHRSIAEAGGGRYSHWGDGVIFSASDNSDPRSNGRRYEARYTLLPARWLVGLSILVLLGAPAVAFRPFAASTLRRAAAGIVPALFVIAAGATATHWMPLRGELVVTPARAATPAEVGNAEGANQGTMQSLPFERLVAPFLIVPSGNAGNEGSYVRLMRGGIELREVTDTADLVSSSVPAFVDGDKIGGEGLITFIPGTAVDDRVPVTIAYRAVVTAGAIGFAWAIFAIAALTAAIARRLGPRPALEHALLVSAIASGLAGLALATLGIVGLAIPPRAADVGVIQFASPAIGSPQRSGWTDAATVERELPPRAGERREDYAVRMNDLVASGVVHVWNYANATTLRLHVPPWSNFVLWALGEIDPGLYRYHYAAWRPAIERGAGMCSQVTLILVDLLREHGYDARIVQLLGHTVVTAEVAPGRWYILDPDVGVAIPHSMEEIERDPEMVRPIYLRAYEKLGNADPDFAAGLMVGFYGREGNHIEPRGGNEMLGEDWVRRERIARALKWGLPLALIAIAVALAGLAQYARRRAAKQRAD